ncbi:hypothetical protein [Mesorhizobium sp. M0578]
MVDSDRIDNLIAAVPPALALRAGLDLGIFTGLGGSAMTADSLGAAPSTRSPALVSSKSRMVNFATEPKRQPSSTRPSRHIAPAIMRSCSSSGEPIY